MRANRALRWAFFAAALIGIGVLASAEPDGASRLVSVQQLPDNMDVCTTWDQPGTGANLTASSQEQTLFAALQQEPSPTPTRTAAAQQNGAPQSDARQGGAQRGGGARFASGGATFVLPNTEEQLRVTADLRAHGSQ